MLKAISYLAVDVHKGTIYRAAGWHPVGDIVESVLSSVGITEKRVTNWLGRPCNCAKRKKKLNELGAWVSRTVGLSKKQILEDFDAMMEKHK